MSPSRVLAARSSVPDLVVVASKFISYHVCWREGSGPPAFQLVVVFPSSTRILARRFEHLGSNVRTAGLSALTYSQRLDES